MLITKIYKPTLLVLGLASLGLFLLGSKPALASNPATINFQGKVVNNDGTNVANGTYSFIFRIYNTASPTTTTSCTSTASCLWEETQSSVTVTNGVFQVELGSACALTSGSCNNSTGGPINWSSTSSLYLTMKFNGDSAGFMSPTIHITSVPFALQADNSTTLSGLAAVNFVQLAQGLQGDPSTTNPSIYINKTGSTANILELQKSSSDVFVVANTGATTITTMTATGTTQTALTVTGPGDTNIANATETGLSITSGAITENTSANTGTFVGANIATPALTLTSGTALNAYGLRITTGSLTQSAGALTENGLLIDSSSTTFTTGGTLNGININVPGMSGGVGTYNGLSIAAASSQTIAGTFTGINLNLNNGNITYTGSGLSAISLSTPADTSLASATVKGIDITSGSMTASTIAATGTYIGESVTIPALTANTHTSTVLNGYGLSVTEATADAEGGATVNQDGLVVATGNLLSNSSGNVNVNGIYVDTSGTSSWGGTGTLVGILDGVNINIGAIAVPNQTSNAFNGLNISTNGTNRTLSVGGAGTFTGINLDLNNHVTANGVSLTGLSVQTPVENSIGNATVRGLTIASGAITESTASNTGTYVAEDVTIPSLTATITSGTALNAYGLRITTGNLNQTNLGVLNETGIYVDSGSTTFSNSGGILNGVNVNIPSVSAGTYRGLNISASTGQTISSGVTYTGINLDLNTNISANDKTITGMSIATPQDLGTGTQNFTKTGLKITSGSITASAATGTYVGADITIPSLTSNTTATAVNGYGLRVTTGNLTQSTGVLTQDGLLVDMSSSTFTTGGNLNGISINPMTTEPSVGTVIGLNIGGITTGGNPGTSYALSLGANWDKQINGTGWSVDGAGNLTINPTANSSSSVRVANTASQSVINVDTTDSTDNSTNNLANNPSVETVPSSSTDWKLKGTATIAQDTSYALYGAHSLKITGAAANDGAFDKLNATLTASTIYNLLFYVKSNDTNTPTVVAGFTIDDSVGSPTESAVCTNSVVVTVSGWTKYSCSFTTPASGITSSNAIFVKYTDSAARTINVDGVVVQLASSANSYYSEGQISLQATITSPLILQGSNNSSTAISIYNASGGQIFSVDTTDTNLLNNPANPGFEVNTAGWTTVVPSGTVTIARDTSQQNYGVASLSVTTGSGAAGQGVRYTLASGSWTAGSYTLSFSLLNSGSAWTGIPIVKFGNGADNACSTVTLVNGATATSPVSGTWTRYAANCTFSGTTTSVAIEQNESTSLTYFLDDVQLETGSTASTYGLGAISLSGQIVSPVTFKNQSNTNTAFQIQNSSGTALFVADTKGSIIQIGSSNTDATAILLALDSYNQSTDPTGTNGAMYYNTSTSTFRCDQGGVWRNCLGGGPSNQSTATQSPTAGTDTYLTGSLVPLAAGGFRGPTGSAQDGSKITWRIVMTKTAAGTAASTFTIRVGTAGTTSDTARCSAFSTGTATAVIDEATVIITVYATAGGSGTTLNCSATLTHETYNASTPAFIGWSNAAAVQAYSTQTSFDSTPAGTKIGLSFDGGTSLVSTIQSVDVTTSNL